MRSLRQPCRCTNARMEKVMNIDKEKAKLKEYRSLVLLAHKISNISDEISDQLNKLADDLIKDIPDNILDMDLADMDDIDIEALFLEERNDG